MDYVSAVQDKHSGGYTRNILKVVKSWLAHNGIQLTRKIRIAGAYETPTLREERVPTQDELKRVFLSASKQARTACVLVAHAGLRLETLGNFRGDDGLRLSDLQELRVGSGEASFETTPTLVRVRPSLSKARHQYFTFLTEEACGYLKGYLEQRSREGEKLTATSSVVTAKLPRKPFIRTMNVSDMIRLPIRRAGLPWRPYVLRAYFDTQLMLAESKGLILRDYRQFWMGHKGDIEARYTTNKNRLPENVVEDMRQAYRRSQVFLQTVKPEVGEDQIRQAFKKQLLAVAGLSEEEIAQYDLTIMSDEELQGLVRRRLLGLMANNGSKQKVVSISQLEQLIAERWEFVSALPNGQAIVKMPF